MLLRCMLVAVCVSLSCSLSSAQYTPAALADEITSLPGLDVQPSFRQFAGYLQVDAASNRSIFYWYTESQSSSQATDPLMWWSNGGPGCSGLMALLTEHGPFRPDGAGGLTAFPWAWNRLANTLYVEAPAGVGFSYSLNASDYTTGDAKTANDNVLALLQFYERFPQLQSNPLFLSSESYGGHYLPELGALLVSPQWSPKFPQFAGGLLGNPLTDVVEGWIYGQGGTLCGHALASRPTCDAFHSACIGNFSLVSCALSIVGVYLESGAMVDPLLDTYGLDYPVCPTNGRARRQFGEAAQMWRMMMQAPLDEQEIAERAPLSDDHQLAIDLVRAMRAAFAAHPEGKKILRQSARAARRSNSPIPPPYSPCMTGEETVYLNRPDVRAALHVSPHAPAKWVQCTSVGQISYSLLDFIMPMEKYYVPLLAQGNLSLALFSGDDDMMCATLGTEHWMYNTFDVQAGNKSWSKWTYESAEWGTQYGGSAVQFDGISLVTVHQAGHMVSGYQPERGFAVLSGYLAGNWTGRPLAATAHTRHAQLQLQLDLEDAAAELESLEIE